MPIITPQCLVGATIPHLARDLPEPPKHLYLVGELPRGPAVAVVGTRHPTEEALQFTEELVCQLARHGVAIWSGGAAGIDAKAHLSALRAGAPTVVVAPAGWLAPFPPEHGPMFHEIVQNQGAYLSIVPPHRQARRHLFFARNALLTALVGAVVIVQAGLRSGARNTAKFARKLGRPVFAVPSCPWIHQGLGCNLEIANGARAYASVRQVVEAVSEFGCGVAAKPILRVDRMGDEGGPSERPPQFSSTCESGLRSRRAARMTRAPLDTSLDAELTVVFDAIRAGATNVDSICGRTGIPLPVVQSDVLRLTLLGLVRTDQGGVINLVRY